MGYQDAVEYLNSLGIDAMKSLAPTLHRIEALCGLLDHPERAIPAIHVTGTNGKTSTARIATSVLAATGLRVGTYTSPHLQSIRERFALNGEAIPAEDFGDLFDHVYPFVELVERSAEDPLSFFEILTAMFFLWAADSADAMVVEVGLGGRWDATNVTPAAVAVITNIGLDHTGLLGTDRATIAGEKAGIIKPGSRVVTGVLDPEILKVIAEEAASKDAPVLCMERDFRMNDNRVAFGGRYLSVETSSRSYEDLFLPLHGAHQGANALIALVAVGAFLPAGGVGRKIIAEGLTRVSVPGRLESLHGDATDPVVILDVAHNPDGMSALVTSLIEAFAFERAIFVVGILGDKDYRGMLTELTRLPCSLMVTEAKSVRSVPPQVLHSAAMDLGLDSEIAADIATAVKTAVAEAGVSDLVCITGSHYVVGDARTILVGPLA